MRDALGVPHPFKMRLSGVLALSVVTVISVISPSAPGASTEREVAGPPLAIAGIWDVARVLVDGQDQIHWGYRPDDPQFVGRELVVDGARVSFNGSGLSCKQDTWRPQVTTWAKLIGKAFPRSPVGGRKKTPTTGDFDLPFAGEGVVNVYPLCPPRKAGRGYQPYISENWLAVQAPDKVAFRVDASALLILVRRPEGAKPRASFPCEKAATVPEKTICGSFTLAAWDRSVALAWKEAIQGMPQEADRIREQQKSWLRERDACGSDAHCLEDQMSLRTMNLVHE